MATVTHTPHGVYCYTCQEVFDSTDDCEHDLGDKAGVEEPFGEDGYVAQPNDMGHMGPHMFQEIDGMEMCVECTRVKIPTEMVNE